MRLVLPVVIVVGDDLRDAAISAGLGGQVTVPGLDVAPAAPQELLAAGEEFAARGHAGRGADEVIVKDGGPFSEAAEVGRLHVAVLVGLQGVKVQTVDEHVDDVHDGTPRVGH